MYLMNYFNLNNIIKNKHFAAIVYILLFIVVALFVWRFGALTL